MSVINLDKSINELIVLFRAFLCGKHTVRLSKIKQILSCLDGLKTMSNHDHSDLTALVLLNLRDSALYLSLTLWIQS